MREGPTLHGADTYGETVINGVAWTVVRTGDRIRRIYRVDGDRKVVLWLCGDGVDEQVIDAIGNTRYGVPPQTTALDRQMSAALARLAAELAEHRTVSAW